MHKSKALFFILVLLAAGFAGLQFAAPLASADQVPAGSGLYYHVGDNIMRRVSYSQPVGTGPGGAGTFCLSCPTDLNASSYATTTWGFSGSSTAASTQSCASNNVANTKNYTITVASSDAALADYLTLSFQDQTTFSTSLNPCMQVGIIFADGTASAPIDGTTAGSGGQVVTNAANINRYYNFTPATVRGIWILNGWSYNGVAGSFLSVTGTTQIQEIGLWNKNATNSNFVAAFARLEANNSYAFGTSVAQAFTSNSFTLGPGTWNIALTSIASKTATVDPDNWTFSGFTFSSQQVLNISEMTGAYGAIVGGASTTAGGRTCQVVVWQVSLATQQTGTVSPTGGSTTTNQELCALDPLGNGFAPQNQTTGRTITADTTNYGGSSSGIKSQIGRIWSASDWPFTNTLDTDFLSIKDTLPINLYGDGITLSGVNLINGGWTSANNTFTINAPTISSAGNARVLIVGQAITCNGCDESKMQILVNGFPAAKLTYGTDSLCIPNGCEKWAAFLIDDVAARNSVTQTTNGGVGASGYRPILAESYVITLTAGFDNNLPVLNGETLGVDGHQAVSCPGLINNQNVPCSMNFATTGLYTYPPAHTNFVTFNVVTTNNTPLAGVSVKLTNNSSTLLTNANGVVTFNNVYSNPHFTLSLNGYVPLCANFYYSTGAVTSGTSSDGCTYITAANATFTAVMLTIAQASSGGSGSVSVGTGIAFSFTLHFCADPKYVYPGGCSSDQGAISGATYQVSGQTTLTGVQSGSTDQNGLFTIQFASSSSGTWTLQLSKSGYQTGSFVFQIPANNYVNLLYLTTSQVVCTPNPGNFTVPSQAVINATVFPSGIFYAFFKTASNGLPTLVSQILPIPGSGNSAIQLTWPLGRNTTLTPQNDTGAYYIAFSDGSGNVFQTCGFIIYSGSGASPSLASGTDPSLLGLMSGAMQTNVLSYSSTQQSTSQTAQAQDYIAAFASFAFGTWILIPNMYLFLLISIVVGVFMFSRRRV